MRRRWRASLRAVLYRVRALGIGGAAAGQELVAAGLDLVVPRTCLQCGERLEADVRAICALCRAGIPWIEAACPRCGMPAFRPPSGPGASCAWCRSRRLGFHLAAAGGSYEGALRAAVVRFKFHRDMDVLPLLVEAIQRAARAEGVREAIGEAGGVVPIPSHPLRRWLRGWEPVGELASAVAGTLVAGRELPRLALLRKRRWTARQIGLDEEERRANPRGAFQVRPRRSSPPTVVLLDDVLTTGATATDCARALRRAGARRVVLLTAARS